MKMIRGNQEEREQKKQSLGVKAGSQEGKSTAEKGEEGKGRQGKWSARAPAVMQNERGSFPGRRIWER